MIAYLDISKYVTGVLGKRPSLQEFPCQVLPHAPTHQMSGGEGQRKEAGYTLGAHNRNCKGSTPVYLWGADMSCRFK
jgi:hypothetical protein